MIDLTNIPTKYHIIFQCDWNTGNESKMSSLDRAKMEALYLEFNKWEMVQRIDTGRPASPNEFVGGFSEDSDDDNKLQGFVF
jgi:hypothetical protein